LEVRWEAPFQRRDVAGIVVNGDGARPATGVRAAAAGLVRGRRGDDLDSREDALLQATLALDNRSRDYALNDRQFKRLGDEMERHLEHSPCNRRIAVASNDDYRQRRITLPNLAEYLFTWSAGKPQMEQDNIGLEDGHKIEALGTRHCHLRGVAENSQRIVEKKRNFNSSSITSTRPSDAMSEPPSGFLLRHWRAPEWASQPVGECRQVPAAAQSGNPLERPHNDRKLRKCWTPVRAWSLWQT
jgi:hypothetical protein